MAEKKGKLLSTIQDIPADVVQKLGAYWITTAEELLSAAVQEGGIAGLVDITGLAQDAVVHLVERAQAALPAHIAFSPGSAQPHGLGALDDPEAKNITDGGPVSFAPLPPSVDLHGRFGPVRDQGQRGTCVAHAATALREYLVGSQSPQSNFSEQFLYWDCKKHDLVPGEGTFVRVAMNRLEFDGIPGEADWPYNPLPVPGNEGQDPAPAGILVKANANRISSSTGLSATNVDGLRQALADGSPVAFSVPVYTHWFTEPTQSTGDIRMPLPGEKVEGGHAMCMVGYTTDAAVPGGGYFLVRNSWGTGWASQSTLAPGYARMPFAFINQYGKTAHIGAGTVPVPPKNIWESLITWLRGLFG